MANVARYIQWLESEMLADIHEAGRIGFRTTQRVVPVRSGRLKRSLRLLTNKLGFSITANTPYAGVVESRQHYLLRGIQSAVGYLRSRGYR